MKDELKKYLAYNGKVRVECINSCNLVEEARKIHDLTPTATAALGRLLTACSIMGAQLKESKASITLRVNGEDGTTGAIIAVSDSSGNVRGYVQNPDCPTEYYNDHKLNVGKAVGRNGVLNVMKDFGTGEPYIGMVPRSCVLSQPGICSISAAMA